jgi:hypothetical protein
MAVAYPNLSQIAAVTGRKLKFPYQAWLGAQAPAAREEARQSALDEARTEALEQTARQFDAGQRLTREQMDIQKSQAETGRNLQLAQLAGLGLYATDLHKPILSAGKDMLKTGSEGVKEAATATYEALKPGAQSLGDLANASPETVTEPILYDMIPRRALEETVLHPSLEGVTEASLAGTDIAGSGATSLEGVTAESLAGTDIAGSGAAFGAGSLVWPLAAVAGYNLARTMGGGNLNAPYATKTDTQKLFSAPATSMATLPLSIAARQITGSEGNPVSKAADWLGQREENLLGKPVSQLFRGDVLGAVQSVAEDTWNLVTGKTCIIITCCTSPDSDEVNLARAYRDQFLTPEELRGYYMLAEETVPKLLADPAYKQHIQEALVAPLIQYGAWRLGRSEACPEAAQRIAEDFIAVCRARGASVASFTRSNGEVV